MARVQQAVTFCPPPCESDDNSSQCIKPLTLQKLCSDTICFNYQQACKKEMCPVDIDESEVGKFEGYTLPMYSISLPPSISEDFLTTLVRHHLLNDQNLQIFGQQTHLDVVDIFHAPVTIKGLQVLQRHTIRELKLRKINTTLDKVISNTVISDATEKALRVLSLTNFTFTSQSDDMLRKSIHMDTMSDIAEAFKNLVSLTLVNIDLRNYGLQALCKHLSPTVTALDISDNPLTDIEPVKLLAHSLKSLILYNVYRLPESNLKVLMTQLTELKHLDVSRPTDHQFEAILHLETELLEMENLLSPCEHTFRNLISLDISGWRAVKASTVRAFLVHHRDIKFLGMTLVDAAAAEMFQDSSDPGYFPHVEIGSLIGEEKVVECCARYKNRPFYIQKCLLALFQITKQCDKPRADLIQLLVDVMSLHIDEAAVLMAATACLYNLTKNNLVMSIHLEYLKHVAHSVVDCMQRYPTNEALQRNCLLTICSDRMLGEVSFDRYKCIELALECLCKFKDPATTRMCLAITSILAAKVPIDTISDLASNSQYMLRLIEITKEKLELLSSDCVIRFALSALWNLTDESPKACHCFFKLQGLELAVECLQKYSQVPDVEERLQIQIKIVGLLNNIAEVVDLRPHLITASFLEIVRESLRSENCEYAYFSGGILANLLSNMKDPAWADIDPAKQSHVQEEMISAISEWKEPDCAMVAYRCFRVFSPLLSSTAPAASQYWALWAINHVCHQDHKRYVDMIHSGGIYRDVERIAKSYSSCPQVQELAQSLHQFAGEPPVPVFTK